MDTRLLPLGTTRSGVPVYPIWGAMEVEPDEPDDEPQDGDEPDDDPEGSDEGGKKDKGKKSDRYVPPSEAEWARVRSSLDRSNASAKAKRERAQALEKENAELRDRVAAAEAAEERRKLLESTRPAPVQDTGGGKRRNTPPAPPSPTDLPAGVLTPAQVRQQVAQAKREEREAVAAEYLDVAKRSAAKVALSEAQVPRASLGKLIRLIDLDEVELDSDGEVVGGLDEQVESLKADFPQLFASAPAAEPEPPKKQTPRPRPPRIPNANGSGRQPAPERKLSTAERMAADILGER